MTSRRNPLLRTAYGISPDRNLRDRQVSRGRGWLWSVSSATTFLPLLHLEHCIILIVWFPKISCDKYFDISCFLAAIYFLITFCRKQKYREWKQGVDNTQICPAPINGPPINQSYFIVIDNGLDILSLLTKFYNLSCYLSIDTPARVDDEGDQGYRQ